MDRISALRNVEDALRAFENGDEDLSGTERRVAAVLRTYASEFEGEDDVFRAVGEPPVDGTIVVAPSKPAARERVLARTGLSVGADTLDADSTAKCSGESRDDRSKDRNNSGELTGRENDSVPEFEIERVR